ncbi:isovaleryl-CoA dehydrogenase, partial [mine drainage metagenome]
SDLFLTYAKTGGQFTAFVIFPTDEGFSRGKKFNKMGMRGSPTGEIYFENLKVPEDRIVGSLNGGKNIILSGLNIERIILSFIFIGLAKRALEMSLKYCIDRKQFGEPLYKFEMIQDKLATMYTKYETSRIMVYESLKKVEENKMDVLHAASSILYASEVSEQISREAIQIHGGYGYVKDSGIERLL